MGLDLLLLFYFFSPAFLFCFGRGVRGLHWSSWSRRGEKSLYRQGIFGEGKGRESNTDDIPPAGAIRLENKERKRRGDTATQREVAQAHNIFNNKPSRGGDHSNGAIPGSEEGKILSFVPTRTG